MIIRHTRKREDRKEDTHLTLNKKYLVIGVYYVPNQGSKFIIQCDTDNEVGWFLSKYFDLVDAHVPPDFSYTFYESGRSELEPTVFDGDFWDRFHEGDPDAEKIFDQEVKRIKAFHHFES